MSNKLLKRQMDVEDRTLTAEQTKANAPVESAKIDAASRENAERIRGNYAVAQQVLGDDSKTEQEKTVAKSNLIKSYIDLIPVLNGMSKKEGDELLKSMGLSRESFAKIISELAQ